MGRKKMETGIRQWDMALYLRLSKEDKAKLTGRVTHSESIENQDKILSDFITGLREDYPEESFRVQGVYIDDGLTGTNTDKRDEFNRMVDGILGGRINCVLFKDLSRMFRNHTEQSHFLELFCPEHSVRVISINNRLDTFLDPDAVYGYDVTLTGVSNDRYCYTISKNVLRTFEMKKERGEFIGAFAPYGYKKDEENRNKLIIDEEAAAVVRDIFTWYVKGEYSIAFITRRLNDLGILCPSAYKKVQGLNYQSPFCKHKQTHWSSKTVRDILSNQMYIGNMVQNRTRKLSYKLDKVRTLPPEEWIIVENTHEGIISRSLFQKVQHILSLNTKGQERRGKLEHSNEGRLEGIGNIPIEQSGSETVSVNGGNISLFAGLIQCGQCGYAMHRKRNKGSRYALYRCNSTTRISKNYCALRGSIRETLLTRTFLKVMKAQLMTVDNLEEIIASAEKHSEEQPFYHRLQLQYSKVTAALKQVQDKADDLYDNYSSGLILKEQYIRLKDRYEDEVFQNRQRLKNIEEQLMEEKSVGAHDTRLKTIEITGRLDKVERSLLLELIQRVKIYENQQVEIIFKFQDPFLKKFEMV